MKAGKIMRRGVFLRYAEGVSFLKKPGDCVLIERGTPRSVLILCPDGCGETISVNLDKRGGPAWKKYEQGGHLTLYPSVWKQSGCHAHFIVWKDKIIWCDIHDTPRVALLTEDWIAAVLQSVSIEREVHYRTLAEQLDAIPWDVYWACEELVRRGELLSIDKRGTYWRQKRSGGGGSKGFNGWA
jgi:hypothetical protein